MLYVDATLILLLLLFPVLIALCRTTIPTRAPETDTPSTKAEGFDLQALEPYPRHPSSQSRKFHMTMGLRKLDVDNWLTVDKTYMSQHRVRNEILADKKYKVLQCLPGSEAACVELLDLMVDFLTEKYPAMYKLVEGDGNVKRIRNTETGEEFSLEQPFDGIAPLEIAARLVCEDINVLKQGSGGGEHHLYVSRSNKGSRCRVLCSADQHSQRDIVPRRMVGARPDRMASLTAAWHGTTLAGEDRVFRRRVCVLPSYRRYGYDLD